MADKCTSPMLIHKVTLFSYNQWLKLLDTQLKEAGKNPLKVSKVVKPTNKKALL